MDVLLAAIDEAFDRKSWHGTNLRGSIRGLSLEEALWRPAAGRHNIFELTLHAAYWKYTIRRRLLGEKRGSFARKGSNFFETPRNAAESDWREAMALLESEHRAMRAAIVATPLDPKKRHLISGIAAHDLYHAGQIQLIKRLFRGR